MNTASQKKRFRYTNEAVGVFVLLTVIIFIAAFLQASLVQDWFDPGADLKILLPDDGLFGLSDGADIEILGTKAGRVTKIVINPTQQMHADVHIRSAMQSFVRRDSIVTIRKKFGIAGDAYLDITRGTGEPLDWKYAVLTASADRAPTETIGVLIDELRTKIFPLIDGAQQAIRAFVTVADKLQDPQGDLLQLLANLNSISAAISGGEGSIGRLLTQDTLTRDLETLLAAVNEDMTRLGPIFDELQIMAQNATKLTANVNAQFKDMPKMAQDVRDVLASLRIVMRDLRQFSPQLPKIAKNIGESVANIPVLLLQTQQVMFELEQTLKQLQTSWLLGGQGSAKPQPASRISPLEVRP